MVRQKRTFGANLREHRLTLVPDGDIIAAKAVISIETG